MCEWDSGFPDVVICTISCGCRPGSDGPGEAENAESKVKFDHSSLTTTTTIAPLTPTSYLATSQACRCLHPDLGELVAVGKETISNCILEKDRLKVVNAHDAACSETSHVLQYSFPNVSFIEIHIYLVTNVGPAFGLSKLIRSAQDNK